MVILLSVLNLSVEKLCCQPSFKLHLFLKDEAGRKNSTVTPGEITSKVAKVIKHYWVLAGYETVSSPKNKIAKLLKDYQVKHKNRNHTHK